MILILDNYDSFLHNLAHILVELGAEVQVVRNDAIQCDEVRELDPSGIVISPGSGLPAQAGITQELLRQEAGTRPILGVSLGHLAIGELYGGQIVAAPDLMHGKTSMIEHSEQGIFANVPNPFPATRYHSLVIDEASLSDELLVTARAEGLVMGIQHRSLPMFGLQFHPESILTAQPGRQLLENFVRLCQA